MLNVPFDPTVIQIELKIVYFCYFCTHLEYKCPRVHDLVDCSSFSCRVNFPFSSLGKLVALSIPEVLPRYPSKLNGRLLNTDLLLEKLLHNTKQV